MIIAIFNGLILVSSKLVLAKNEQKRLAKAEIRSDRLIVGLERYPLDHMYTLSIILGQTLPEMEKILHTIPPSPPLPQ